MKKALTIVVLSIFLFGNTALTFANGSERKEENRKNTIASLLVGLNSENTGLKTSSAYMLGELEVTSAVIPLMRLLHNDENVEVRISAALALYKIGTPLSIYAVKRAIRFDNSARVNKLAQNFYAEFKRNQNNEKNSTDSYFAQSE